MLCVPGNRSETGRGRVSRGRALGTGPLRLLLSLGRIRGGTEEGDLERKVLTLVVVVVLSVFLPKPALCGQNSKFKVHFPKEDY